MNWKVYYSTKSNCIKIKYFEDEEAAEIYKLFMIETLGIEHFVILPRISYNGTGG